MPCVAVDAIQRDIGDERPDAERLTGEIDVQNVPHKAATAIGADEVPRPHDLVPDLRGDAFGILLEADQFPAKRRLVTQFGKPLPHHSFVEELRYHQKREIRLGRCRPQSVAERRVLKAAVRRLHRRSVRRWSSISPCRSSILTQSTAGSFWRLNILLTSELQVPLLCFGPEQKAHSLSERAPQELSMIRPR